jgi:hypothetical protein
VLCLYQRGLLKQPHHNQIVRLNAQVGGAVVDYIATSTFALNRLGYDGAAAVDTFDTIHNVDYHMQCARAAFRVPPNGFYGVRVGINGNPIGGSTISNVTFDAIKTGELNEITTIVVFA